MNEAAPYARRSTHTITFTTRSSTFVTYSFVEASDSRHGSERWYEPATARWLSNDPIGISGGLNQYVFCGDSPGNFADPCGVGPTDPFESVDDAARDAINYINQTSIALDREFAGTIFWNNDNYFYREPAIGWQHSSNADDAPAPPGTKPVATFHTHGAESGPGGLMRYSHSVTV